MILMARIFNKVLKNYAKINKTTQTKMKKLTSRIIINNRTKLSDSAVMYYVKDVIEGGKISETVRGKQYCFLTTWKTNNIAVSAGRRNNTHTFDVWLYPERKLTKNDNTS